MDHIRKYALLYILAVWTAFGMVTMGGHGLPSTGIARSER